MGEFTFTSFFAQHEHSIDNTDVIASFISSVLSVLSFKLIFIILQRKPVALSRSSVEDHRVTSDAHSLRGSKKKSTVILLLNYCSQPQPHECHIQLFPLNCYLLLWPYILGLNVNRTEVKGPFRQSLEMWSRFIICTKVWFR